MIVPILFGVFLTLSVIYFFVALAKGELDFIIGLILGGMCVALGLATFGAFA